MAKKKTKEETPVTPKVSEFVGKKLKDIRREDGQTILDFSNGYSIILSGYINFEIGETK
jgi:hypothetical protein